MTYALSWFWLLTLGTDSAIAQPNPAAPPPAVEKPGAEVTEVAAVPPPSTWDKSQEQPTPEGDPGGEFLSAWQLFRTAGALLLVVALIYLLFKVGLARFVGVAALRRGNDLRVVERAQLDGRHALLIVEVEQKKRFLIGTGEQGVQLIAQLDPGVQDPGATAGRSKFGTLLKPSASKSPDPPSGQNKDEGPHD